MAEQRAIAIFKAKGDAVRASKVSTLERISGANPAMTSSAIVASERPLFLN